MQKAMQLKALQTFWESLHHNSTVAAEDKLLQALQKREMVLKNMMP